MFAEPSRHIGLGVGPEVVKDHVHVQFLRNLLVYLAKEDEELLMAMLLVELSHHRAIEYVQSCEEVYRAIPLVLP